MKGMKLFIDYNPASPRQEFTFMVKIREAQKEYWYKQSMWLQLWVRKPPKWFPQRIWDWLLGKLTTLAVENDNNNWIKEEIK